MRNLALFSICLPILFAGCQTNNINSPNFADFPKAPIAKPINNKKIEKIIFGSCLQDVNNKKIFETILNLNPDIFFMIGDNIYGDYTPNDPQQSGMRATYWQLSQNSGFIKLAQKVPIFATWDDHDFGDNDAGKNFQYKKITEKMFEHFWNLEKTPIAKRDGIYQSFISQNENKKIQFIILDTRFFRDDPVPSDDTNAKGKERYMPHSLSSNATILGDKQWNWLESELKKPADLRIIISSIQLVANGNGWEAWEKFPAQRNKFYDLIKTTNANNVIILSGDRHHSSINKYDGNPYPIYDFTASPLSGYANNGEKEIAPNRIYVSPKGVLNFGEILINWESQNLSLNLYDENGKNLHEMPISFADIK